MLIAYKILFETEEEYCSVGPFFDNCPIDDKRILKELQISADDDIAILDPSEIDNMLLVAIGDDELQIFELDPADFFPLHPAHFERYYNPEKGGDK